MEQPESSPAAHSTDPVRDTLGSSGEVVTTTDKGFTQSAQSASPKSNGKKKSSTKVKVRHRPQPSLQHTLQLGTLRQIRQHLPPWSIAAAAAVIAAGLSVFLVKKLLARPKAVRRQDYRAAITGSVNIDQLDIEAAGQQSTSLLKIRLVVTDALTEEGRVRHLRTVLQALLQGGASLVGTGAEDRLLEDLTLLPNPAVPGCVTGGGAHGGPVAVAAGLADLAIAMDAAGELRVPSACCGLYCLRSSAGTLSEGPISSNTSQAVSLAAAQVATLIRAGKVLGMKPDGSKDLQRLIIAEDLLELFDISTQQLLTVALRKAGLRWGGQGQVATASVMPFVADNVHSLDAAAGMQEAVGSRNNRQNNGTQESGVSTADVLERIGRAADAMLAQGDGNVRGDSTDHAKTVAAVCREMSSVFGVAFQERTLLLLPALGGPPPSRSSEQLQQWQRLTGQLQGIATLTGTPIVTIPLQLANKQLFSVALLGSTGSELRILAAAEKLGPMIQHEIDAILGDSNAEQGTDGSSLPRPKTPTQRESNSRGVRKGLSNGIQSNQQEKGEMFKSAGNEAFKNGAYEIALQHYTDAIEAVEPTDVVAATYYSNRAMTYLKLLQFDLAKNDCDSALKLQLAAKTLLRRGTARLGLHDIGGAEKDFKQVLALEPKNRQAIEELRNLRDIRATYGPYDNWQDDGGAAMRGL